MPDPPAVLSIDVELFEHTPAYRSASGELHDRSTGIEGVEFLLEAFDRHGYETTCFVVAEIADEHPRVLDRIESGGHEIGSHTSTHRQLSTVDEEGRRDEIAGSRRRLESAIDGSVEGFRAPVFDLPPGGFDLIEDAGYRYDSSVLPARRIPGFYGGSHERQRPGAARHFGGGDATGIDELPVSVMPGLRLPLSGAWLRLFGVTYVRAGLRLLARRGITPVLYVHPWELVDLPRIEGVPKRVYWRTGAWMRRAIERLLDEPFRYVRAGWVVEEGREGSVA